MLKDTLDIRQWIEAAPLDAAESHVRSVRAERKRRAIEWYKSFNSDEPDEPFEDEPDEPFEEGEDEDEDKDVPDLSSVVSPVTLAYIEQYRARRQVDQRGWPSSPVDAIVWAIGEPPSREFTKIGGLPYRPAGIAWPAIPPGGYYPEKTGTPMTFLGQINFAGSRDLPLPPLPNDVLLIFAENEEFARPECLHFEWYPATISESELVTAADVPAPAWKFVSCHGFRHRTVDYRAELPEELSPYHPLRISAVIHGTKIGGVPIFGQSELADDFQMQLKESNTRFLAQIKSIYPHNGPNYPWLNRHDSYEEGKLYSDDHVLEIVDAGSIFLVLDAAGKTTWDIEIG